jgi:hypothetical protein
VVRSIEESAFGWESFADHPPGCLGLSARYELPTDRPRKGYGPSVFRGAVLVVRAVFVDHPLWSHGLSTRIPQIVRPRHYRLPKSLLLELRFRVALGWGFFLWLIGLL